MEKMAVYIDFDKTISPIHGFSVPPTQETVDAINLLYTKYKIVIYSARANKEICHESDHLQMLEYLRKYNIQYNEICANKPLYIAIIDDRSFNPLKESWGDIIKTLMA